MHHLETESKPIAMQKRQRASQIAHDFTSRMNRVCTYVETQRKRVNYDLIKRAAKSLSMSRSQVVDALNATGLR